MKFRGKGIYFTILATIFIFNLIGLLKERSSVKVSDLEDFTVEVSDRFTSMEVVFNGKTSIVTETSEISRFITILRSCTMEIQSRKMRTQDRVTVTLHGNARTYEFVFRSESEMPFLLVSSADKQFSIYDCTKMEFLLSKYK